MQGLNKVSFEGSQSFLPLPLNNLLRTVGFNCVFSILGLLEKKETKSKSEQLWKEKELFMHCGQHHGMSSSSLQTSSKSLAVKLVHLTWTQ